MNDTQLYEQILGLAPPWRVAGITLKKDLRQIEIEVVCDETVWPVPSAGGFWARPHDGRVHRPPADRK